MPARLPRPDWHPIQLLRRMEAWHPRESVVVELVTYVSSSSRHPLKTTSDFGLDREVEAVESCSVTPETLHRRFEQLGDDETLGLSSRVNVDGVDLFLPQCDFLGADRPVVPGGLREAFSVAAPALYKTDASWHLYGRQLFPADRWTNFLITLERAKSAFVVDLAWLRCSRERGFSVLRWSRKAGRPGGTLPTAVDALEKVNHGK